MQVCSCFSAAGVLPAGLQEHSSFDEGSDHMRQHNMYVIMNILF